MQEAVCSSLNTEDSERISLCMIVKNEEAFIGKCLQQVCDLVDEIVVVDTGSTDGTLEICGAFGAKVFAYPWTDDFAAARNHSLKHATGDWILWLDADEQVDSSDAHLIREAVRSSDVDFFALRLINYYTDPPNLDESFQLSHLRMFRNRHGITFKNKIHEMLDVRDVEQITNLPVRVHHYGYMPSVMKNKDKHNRNLEMLKNELQNPDYSPWIHYHIASEYYNLGHLEIALKHLDFGILKFVLSGLKPPSMCYRLKYTILLELEQTDKTIDTLDKAITIYPDYVDLHFMKGLFLFEQMRYSEAETAFRHCAYLGESEGGYLTLRGVGSFRAWHGVGLCLERLGKLKEAQTAYKFSLSFSPSFAPSLERLEVLTK